MMRNEPKDTSIYDSFDGIDGPILIGGVVCKKCRL